MVCSAVGQPRLHESKVLATNVQATPESTRTPGSLSITPHTSDRVLTPPDIGGCSRCAPIRLHETHTYMFLVARKCYESHVIVDIHTYYT
ncbi:Uncharacterised protein [Mycobacteroides abscessus subsp. abscessus]|nr:Uncharacterised protein [Mycobacteroides abscessus subsp. abscessus]